MREIKFRGKRKDNGQWIDGNLIHTISHCDNGMPEMYFKQWEKETYYIQPIMTIGDERAEFIEVIPETIEQYTNLKDKNGKEIYEGDIIEFSYDIFTGNFDTRIGNGIIEFIGGAFYIKPFEIENKKINDIENEEWFLLYSVNEDTLEVIGNIHDNPELLEESK